MVLLYPTLHSVLLLDLMFLSLFLVQEAPQQRSLCLPTAVCHHCRSSPSLSVIITFKRRSFTGCAHIVDVLTKNFIPLIFGQIARLFSSGLCKICNVTLSMPTLIFYSQAYPPRLFYWKLLRRRHAFQPQPCGQLPLSQAKTPMANRNYTAMQGSSNLITCQCHPCPEGVSQRGGGCGGGGRQGNSRCHAFDNLQEQVFED